MIRLGLSAATAATILAFLAAPAPAQQKQQSARPSPQSNADTYRQLSLFGDVFERVRSDDESDVGGVTREMQDRLTC